MSSQRSRKSRGISPAAAYIFAVILAGVGFGVQIMIPATSTPATLVVTTEPTQAAETLEALEPQVESNAQAAAVGGVLADDVSGATLYDARTSRCPNGQTTCLSP